MKCQKCDSEIRWKPKCPYCETWVEGNEKRPEFPSTTFGYKALQNECNAHVAVGIKAMPAKQQKTPLLYLKENE